MYTKVLTLIYSHNYMMPCSQMDEKGGFYDRYEAYDIAMTNGQMSATARHYKLDKGERELFSEDLY